jgi:hypothetical protein
MPRGPAGSRGGPRRGGSTGGGRYRDRPFRDDRPYRDDQQRRMEFNAKPKQHYLKIFLLAKSPSQQQAPLSQQTGEHQNDEQQQQQQQQQYQQSRPYRGGSSKLSASENIQIYINLSGQGSGRGEYRRPYGNSARGSRGSYNRSHADPNTPDLDNTTDFPNLAKP